MKTRAIFVLFLLTGVACAETPSSLRELYLQGNVLDEMSCVIESVRVEYQYVSEAEFEFLGVSDSLGFFKVLLGIGPRFPHGRGRFAKAGFETLEISLGDHVNKLEDGLFGIDIQMTSVSEASVSGQ